MMTRFMAANKGYSSWPQIYASFSISIAGMCTGTFHGFSAVVIPLLQRPESRGGWGITLEQGSWIAGLFFIGTIFGSVAGGTMNQLFGPKRICVVLAPTILVLWMISALSSGVEWLYATRILLGACYGFFLSLVKVYNAEISHPDLRGTTSTFYSIMLSLGLLYSFVLGYFLDQWRLITGLLTLPALAFLILSCTIPNSPFWLIQNGRDDEARRALEWLRGGAKFDVTDEFNEIRAKKTETADKKGSQGLVETLFSSAFLRPFFKIGLLMWLVEWSGVNVIAQYMVIIFNKSGTNVEATTAPVYVALVRLAFALVSSAILRCSPRKPLLIISSATIAFSFFTLGSFIYVQDILSESGREKLSQNFGWVPLVSVMLIQGAQTIGFLSVLHFNLHAESFPTEIRAIGCGMLGVVTSLTRFITTKLFPQLIALLHFHGVFWFFSGITVSVVVYAWAIIPENKGQSLVKTEDKLGSRPVKQIKRDEKLALRQDFAKQRLPNGQGS